MNFVAQVEDHLRDLGAEARKSHPGKSSHVTITILSNETILNFVSFFINMHDDIGDVCLHMSCISNLH